MAPNSQKLIQNDKAALLLLGNSVNIYVLLPLRLNIIVFGPVEKACRNSFEK